MSATRCFSWLMLAGLGVLLFATAGGGKAKPSMYLERTVDGKLTPTFRVKTVLDTRTLILEGGTSINLLGIEGNSNDEAVAFVRRLVSKTKIALVSDKDVKGKNLFYVYLVDLDEKDLPFKINYSYSSPPEARGFTDLKVGLFSVMKGIFPNLNTILLRSGWAEVDGTYPFEHLSHFQLCEEDAKKNRRGFWAQQGD